jgi:hypothetical protein
MTNEIEAGASRNHLSIKCDGALRLCGAVPRIFHVNNHTVNPPNSGGNIVGFVRGETAFGRMICYKTNAFFFM